MSSSSDDSSCYSSDEDVNLKLEKLAKNWNEQDSDDNSSSESSNDEVLSDNDDDSEESSSSSESDDGDDDEEEDESDSEGSEGETSTDESEYEEVEIEVEESASEVESGDEANDTACTQESNDDDSDNVSVVDDGNIEDTLQKKTKKKKQKVKIAPLTAPSADDNEDDANMKALLAGWGGDEDEADDSDSDSDYDDSDVSEREVDLEDNVIDHIVLAAGDLDQAMDEFEKMTGVAAVNAVTIKGLGIKSARISFSDSSYIEIIAPDPKEPGPIGYLLKSLNLTELKPFHFAIRSSRAEQLKTEVKEYGYVPDHITMFGGKSDGSGARKWELLYLYGHQMGGICPFFINWSNSEHPCAKLPVVGKLKKFSVRAPENDPVHKLLDHIGVQGVNVEVGKPKLSFQFSSPEGTVKFASSKAMGFKFPGFEDDCGDVGALEQMGGSAEAMDFDSPEIPDMLPVASEDEYQALPPPAY